MKKYKIKYQRDINIEVVSIQANDKTNAMILFYMKYPYTDILSIEEE